MRFQLFLSTQTFVFRNLGKINKRWYSYGAKIKKYRWSFFQVCIWRNSVVFFLTFQTFLKDFHPFLSINNWLCEIIGGRFAPTERTSVSSLSFSSFAPPCSLELIVTILTMTVFSSLSRNTAEEIINYLLGWLLQILANGDIFSSWEKLEDYC